MYYIILLLIFLIGASIGSFLNVVIYRIPRGESIVYPPSKCPYCGHKLAWYDMIPILSYIMLGGKCRYCGKRISPLYPAIEFITGLWTVIVFVLVFPQGIDAFVEVLVFGYFAIVLSVIDMQLYILPNKILLPMAVFEVAWTLFAFALGWETLLDIRNRVIGSLVLLVFFLIIYYLVPDGMGEGDVKLSPIIGWFLGFPKIVPWFFIAFGLGALVGIVFMLMTKIFKGESKHVVPFGPFMLWGAVLAWFYGIPIILWYRRLFFI
ncbi:prepilin peptidase [bacterium 3DAC]|nr:prepilin peptidase [Dictyoglomota bacterium]UZN23195.1 prepilin peptidase [bacterium 3DAC]